MAGRVMVALRNQGVWGLKEDSTGDMWCAVQGVKVGGKGCGCAWKGIIGRDRDRCVGYCV